MKKIGLLSDTHGYWDERYEKYLKECDEIWHAGDIGSMEVADKLEAMAPLRAVYGNIDNCDMRLRFPEVYRWKCEEVDVLMKHIGGYPGRYDASIRRQIYANPPQLFISGHSHLLKVENDAFYVFTHILQHFYKEGVGLRQVCDWCRLLYTYKDSMNYGLLESRIKRAGLMSEWRCFATLAVEYLGMPVDAMPFYSNSLKWKKKADRIMEFILKSGNMGHNRDMSHFSKYPYLIRKCVSMSRRVSDMINHTKIFPLDSLRFFPRIMFNGAKSAMRGE